VRLRGLFALGLFACSACSSPLRVGFIPEDGSADDTDGGAPGPDASVADGGDATAGEAAVDDTTAEEAALGAADATTDGGPPTEEPTPDAAPPIEDTTLADTGDEPLLDASPDAGIVDEPADEASADGTAPDATVGDAALPGVDAGSVPDDAQGEGSAQAVNGDATVADANDAQAESSAQAVDGGADDAQAEAAIDGTAATVEASDAQGSDAADASTVVPVLSGGHYVFSWNQLVLEIDPQTGGRVVTFSLAGQNVLTGPSTNAINYGSTFWTSPQADWGWPPVPEIDSLPYAASVDGGTLTLRGSTSATLGVAITKAFSVDAVTGAVSIAYTISNGASAARSFAPWEVTRVRPTGLMFFPTGSTAYSADSGPPLPTTEAGGATWFDADTAATSADTKFFATAARGWLAQASGGLLFVKKFPDVSASAAAPGEAEVEMFASGDGAYVELEAQGPYVPIAAGGALAWSTTWFLVELPGVVDAGVGSASLVSFVDSL
jgi:hypothetical protein